MVSPQDAARFLDEATFGATDADIHDVSMNGYQAWLTEQFGIAADTVRAGGGTGVDCEQPALRCGQRDLQCGPVCENDTNENLVQGAFWQQSLTATR